MIQWFNKQMSKKRKGFTLIELVVVIAILGILAAIAIPRFSNVTNNAKDKANLSEHQILVSAVQMFRASSPTMALPATAGDLDAYIEGGVISLDADGTVSSGVYENANGTHSITIAGDGSTVTVTSKPSTSTAAKVTVINK